MSDFRQKLDLASALLGANVEMVSDEYFALVENLIKPASPIFDAERYTDHGKWMDGWESRRKRSEGHDYCIIRLGTPGRIDGVVVDTSFFTGNYPEFCSIEACALDGYPDPEQLLDESTEWHEVLPRSPLKGDTENLFEVSCPYRFTHVRLHIYPDGGVARLRVHGTPVPRWHRIVPRGAMVDLASVAYGADVIGCSDMFYSSRTNLIMPGDAVHMGHGWETKRRRDDGHDWVTIQLAGAGSIRHAVVDTTHFKGNSPRSVMIEGCRVAAGASADELKALDDSSHWRPILVETALRPNTKHHFIQELTAHGPVSVVRVHIYPDGGLARLRLYGEMHSGEQEQLGTTWLNALPPTQAWQELLGCCGSTRWASEMVEARPFESAEALMQTADDAWIRLDEDDWMEAFGAHPRIGETPPVEDNHSRWSSEEQAGTHDASEATLTTLRQANQQYEERFGHVFLICATGKTADEMLSALSHRLKNSPDHEIKIAAEEQAKITRLRLKKLLAP